jgi:hypothetical protein
MAEIFHSACTDLTLNMNTDHDKFSLAYINLPAHTAYRHIGFY